MSDEELLKQAKAYFAQIHKIDLLIQRLRSTVSEMRSIPTGQSPVLRPYKAQTSNEKTRRKDAMPRMVDLEEQVDSRIDELVAMRNEAFAMIVNVPDFNQQNILVARYIQRKDWADIAEELEFSIKWVLKLHARGIRAFAQANRDFLVEWKNRTSKV